MKVQLKKEYTDPRTRKVSMVGTELELPDDIANKLIADGSAAKVTGPVAAPPPATQKPAAAPPPVIQKPKDK